MTDWIVLELRRGLRPEDREAGVRMSWRTFGKGAAKRSLAAHFTIAALVVQELGWAAKERVIMAHDPAWTMLRIARGDGPASRSFAIKHGTGAAQLGLPWVNCASRPAEPVEHRIEDGALIITLPDWARPPTEEPRGRATPLSRPTPAPTPPQPAPPSETAATTHDIKVPDGKRSTATARATGLAPVVPRRHVVSKRQIPAPLPEDAAPPTERDMLEAKQALRAGRSVRAVAEEWGLRLPTVIGWQDEVIAETKARAA